MLILQRKAGESFQIGQDVIVRVTSVEKGKVSLAIEAPLEIPIMRTELLETQKANKESAISQINATDVLSILENVVDSGLKNKKG